MPQLLIATNNRGKQEELHSLLRDLKVALVTPADLGLTLEVAEDGTTYQENAAKKARAFAQASGLIVLADDSGLEVDALDNAPGLYSARYAPQPNATDADRRTYLLTQLQSYNRPWKARFRCVVAIGTPAGALEFAEGICPGEIIPEERGDHGFGYDPIFLLPSQGKTMAELSMDQKNQLSHRALAVQAAKPKLEILLARL
ncbi:MAG TPA: non-canonical purine NTP pyrophosphatase, RdgB/HAM1 family [Chloroflexi bacterium]|nr:non-canonical purine NTP pyrophosphatase, RdgB/HAM1 family [Chloroflexota bacterium]